MMRFWPCLILLALAQPAWAGRDEGPYYGPMKRWHGIGYKFGYEDRVEKDGSWRIDAAIHGRGDAIDMALYRAAERARDEGYRYVFLLGGNSSKSPGMDAATLYARPSREAVAPVGCRSRKPTTCYTADVAEVLRILGGPNGTRPGTPIVHHRDAYGREVFLSGYGTGAVVALAPGGRLGGSTMTIVDGRVEITGPAPARLPPATAAVSAAVPAAAPIARVAAMPVRAVAPPVVTADAVSPRRTASTAANDRFERALKASQPIRGGDPKQGWTISD